MSNCPVQHKQDTIKVCVTGAAGQIAYSLLYMIAKGDVFGREQPVILTLLDITPMMGVLNGVVMELSDCSFPLLKEAIATDNPEVAFKDIDAALLVGAMPRREGMERKDLLAANVKIFKTQGKALDQFAKKNVKVIVVGNPANTNACIASKYAPSIPKENFSAMTRLDQNRAQAQVAAKLGIPTGHVENVLIWGNHSSTQFPDVTHSTVTLADGTKKPARAALNDDHWVNNDFVTIVQKRGAAVIAARKLSSAMSAAKACCDHMRDWWCGVPAGQYVSMAVISDGSYDIPAGLCFSFPCVTRADHSYSIVKGLKIDDYSRGMLDKTTAELKEELEQAMATCSD